MAVCWSCWRSFLFILFPFVCLRNYTFTNGHTVTIQQPQLTEVLPDRVSDDAIDQIELHGRYFASGMQIKLTGNESMCDDNDSSYELREMWILSTTVARLSVVPSSSSVSASNTTTYFCLRSNSSPSGEISEWRHAGKNVFIKFSPRTQERLDEYPNDLSSLPGVKSRRDLSEQQLAPLRIIGVRIEHADKEPDLSETGDGVPLLLAGVDAVARIFGEGITTDTWITFTQYPAGYGGACQLTSGGEHRVEQTEDDLRTGTGRIHINLPLSADGGPFYLCAKQQEKIAANITASEAVPYVHQGSEAWLQIRTYKKLLPLGVAILIIIACLSFSALFSGLNLGLMSLDRTELKILCNTGNETERKYARVIQPVRDHGNYLLCSILLGNVLVNSTFTILLDDLTSGLVAVICSTLAIVMFGEISPQALCSRHGLAVGANTIYITKAVMVLTFPLSYPISKVLDWILGEEIGNVYNRERLKELVKVTTDINDLDKDEVNIISGALELRKKTVAAVMTRIEDVFMLENEAVLDFETVSEIMKSGFSRIPVYEGNRNNIVTVLYIKDLAFVDPDDNTPLKTLCQFYQNPCNFVFEDETLDVMFRQFKEGNKGHMAFVTRVNNEGDCDPFYETIGLVTLEDVIEELIQAEIMDETDVFTDNRSKRRRLDKTKRQDFSMFAERRENQRIQVSPQLALATYQYLSTSVDLFKKDALSETTLRRLLKQDVFRHVKRNKKQEKEDPSIYIYQQSKPVDYFALILEGRVEVTVGRENLIFEAGPFTYFGLQALTQTVSVAESPVVASQMGSLQSLNIDALHRFTFAPDYSVRAVTDVLYMVVRRNLYLAAKRATLMERSTTDHLDDDDDKFLYSLDGDEESSMGRTSPRQLDSAAPPANHTTTSVVGSPRLQSPAIDTTESPLDPNGVAMFPQDEDQHDEEELTSLLIKRPPQPQQPQVTLRPAAVEKP